MDFGAAPVRGAGHRERRDGDTAAELHLVRLAVAPDPQPQPVRQRIDHRYADPVQPARDLVAVLVELAARVELRHHDLGRRALEFVVVLDVDRNAAAVVDDRHRIVGVDDDLDVVAVPGQRFVDRVVEHLEHHVVQTRAVRRVADVHARPLAHGVEALQHLDAGRIVVFAVVRRLGACLGHRGFRSYFVQARMHRRRLAVGAGSLRGSPALCVRCASASRRTCSRRDPEP